MLGEKLREMVEEITGGDADYLVKVPRGSVSDYDKG